MFYPNKEEFKKIANENDVNIIPLCAEIINDEITPISVFKILEEKSKYTYLLESVEKGENLGRYTFLGVDSIAAVKYSYKDKKFTVTGDDKVVLEENTSDPLCEMRKYMKQFNPYQLDSLPPFIGGAVGYVGYDVIRTIEDLPDVPNDDTDIPDIFFMISDTVLAFDHLKHKIQICNNIMIKGKDIDTAYDEAVAKINYLISNRIGKVTFDSMQGLVETANRDEDVLDVINSSNFKKEDFKKSVLKCKDYIKEGDILQVVLSQRFQKKITVPPLEIYRTLRAVNPSPYMFYLKFDNIALAGSSPETMVKLTDKIVTTRPIAGTRKRGVDDVQDKQFAEELLADEKERAEHLMLVDLGRNDIGKVAKSSSVEVSEFMQIEKYSHVMHIVSNVKGELEEDFDIYDVIKATFPAGTVSGAPKIRAMEIIDELEPTKRGPYAGLMGYISFSGEMDSCITIRTIVCKDENAYVQAGAGIVADSDPEKEYEETVNKAMALMKAVCVAEGRNK